MAKTKELKGEIKFNLTLSDEQKKAKELILNNTITVLNGEAGSGKTTVACQVAMDLLFRKQIEKIIITRALVTDEEVGILPGGIDEKLAPFTAPVYDNMERLYSKEKLAKLIEEGMIEVIPVGFMKGRNFSNSLVIVDEAQNLTKKQAEKVLTRLCIGSKAILCGDIRQCDLKKTLSSCLHILNKHIDSIEGGAIVNFTTNYRHPIVRDILRIFTEEEKKDEIE